nr:MAG TPA: hypothetical protein [Caudoviricetes sp.]
MRYHHLYPMGMMKLYNIISRMTSSLMRKRMARLLK